MGPVPGGAEEAKAGLRNTLTSLLREITTTFAVTIQQWILCYLYGNGQGMVIGSYFHHYDGISLLTGPTPICLDQRI